MTRDSRASWLPQSNRGVYLGLALVSLLIRLPFFKTFNLVSFDGTYYLTQARALFSGGPPPGSFPVGYPFFVALLLPALRDPVLAGQVVSLVAGLGTVLVTYKIATTYMKRELAAACALFVSAAPLFIRLTLATFSESLYTFWVMLGLLMFIRARDLGAGLSLGVASLVRPEVLGVIVPLALVRRRPKAAGAMLVAFVLLYSINTITTWVWHDRIEILPKSKFFAASVEKDWQAKERTIETADAETAASDDVDSIMSDFLARLPREIGALARHVGVLAMLLALLGAVRKPTALLAALLPVLAIPLFTVRSEARYLLPYLPIIVIYAFIAVNGFTRRDLQRVGLAALAISALAGIIVNRGEVTQPVDEGHLDLKAAGLALRDRIEPGAIIADRKPYLPFYAGGRYLEIPEGDYEDTMQYLIENDVDYLSLHLMVVAKFRRSLWPLVGEEPAILGERRFEQIESFDDRIVVYERVREATPLEWTRLTSETRGGDSFPAWSPDGSNIVFVSDRRGNADIYMIPADGGSASLVVGWPGDQTHPAWSPDGGAIAFTSEWRGQQEIHTIDLATKKTERIVEGAAAPSWAPDGSAIAYHVSGPRGNDLVSMELATGKVTRLSHSGNNSFPVYAPRGMKIAWVREQERLDAFDMTRQIVMRARLPKQVGFRPTWSPDGDFIAVTARDWGSTDVYIVDSGGRRAILLTTNEGFDGHPAWSPDGQRIAVVSVREGGAPSLWLVSGFGPSLERLTHPPDIAVLNAPSIQAQP